MDKLNVIVVGTSLPRNRTGISNWYYIYAVTLLLHINLHYMYIKVCIIPTCEILSKSNVHVYIIIVKHDKIYLLRCTLLCHKQLKHFIANLETNI